MIKLSASDSAFEELELDKLVGGFIRPVKETFKLNNFGVLDHLNLIKPDIVTGALFFKPGYPSTNDGMGAEDDE